MDETCQMIKVGVVPETDFIIIGGAIDLLIVVIGHLQIITIRVHLYVYNSPGGRFKSIDRCKLTNHNTDMCKFNSKWTNNQTITWMPVEGDWIVVVNLGNPEGVDFISRVYIILRYVIRYHSQVLISKEIR